MNALRKILVLQLFIFMVLLVADVMVSIDQTSNSYEEIAEIVTETNNPSL